MARSEAETFELSSIDKSRKDNISLLLYINVVKINYFNSRALTPAL